MDRLTIIGLDPGPVDTGVAIVELGKMCMLEAFVYESKVVEEYLEDTWPGQVDMPVILVQEMYANMGMPIGESGIRTIWQIGRFSKCWKYAQDEMHRATIKHILCGNTTAKDTNVRHQIVEMFGGKERAIGGRKCKQCKGKCWFGPGRPVCTECNGTGWKSVPGPLACVKSHAWSALAVALAYAIKSGNLSPLVVNPSGLCKSFQR